VQASRSLMPTPSPTPLIVPKSAPRRHQITHPRIEANFLTDLTDWGLACPLLVVSDGAAGLIAAIEQVFPAALRQRCLIHRERNELTCAFVYWWPIMCYGPRCAVA
jgi:Transposase, Mutator family